MAKHYHLIGIGGIGMAALASLLLDKGCTVSGSDMKETELTNHLKRKGATVFKEHHVENIKGADYIVYSSAIRATNPEMIQAVSAGIPILKRAELLAELVNQEVGITVAGAHGKTTTTSMVSHILLQAGLKPTTAVGGIINSQSTYNANLGTGKYFVAEADESDGTFLYFKPMYAILTNIDFEHVDFYKNWDNILAAYRKFIQRIKPEGCLFYCGEDARLRQLVMEEKTDSASYGLTSECDIYAENITLSGYQTQFQCYHKDKLLGLVCLIVPGRHNVLNALGAIALGLRMGVPFETIQSALMSFSGVKRRFQLKGSFPDLMVVDDYGHHPTEIVATLNAAKSFGRKRLVVVFQPHRYSRTQSLFSEFIDSLSLSDYLVLTDVYAAGEKPSQGIGSQELFPRIQEQFGMNTVYLQRDKILSHLMEVIRPGDLVVTLGAGDITQLSDELVAAWQASHPVA
ncbi:MAG: UDP-N-acetylmuramate--L-alanine ligase [Candidatus Omnitrophica bacterium]|nr:UDP-N-acetylmuramate--L-alanine ligase [Candidatus Omnitrophota bacterium]